ncbi:MAG TPA: hypothetical protein VF742_06530, partial [Terracidiphilus sp.]
MKHCAGARRRGTWYSQIPYCKSGTYGGGGFCSPRPFYAELGKRVIGMRDRMIQHRRTLAPAGGLLALLLVAVL